MSDIVDQPAVQEAQPAEPVNGATVFDISGESPVPGTLAHDEVHDAVASGKFSLPKGSQVPVIGPDGQMGTIDAAEAYDAFNNGYKYATPKDVDQFKYGSLGQQAATVAEGLAQGVAGPLAPMAETALGLTTKENILGRERTNPMEHYGAQAAGFIAPAIATLGASAAERLGVEGAGAVAEGLANAFKFTQPGLVGEAAAKLIPSGGNFVTQVGSAAARGAFEGALLQGSDEATKLFLQDPNQSADTVIAHMGLSSLLGSAVGTGIGLLGQVGKGVKALYGKALSGLGEGAEEALNPLKNAVNPQESMQGGPGGGLAGSEEVGANKPVFVSELDQPALEAGDFQTTVQYSPVIKEADKKTILSGLNETKDHAPEIIAAGERLGSPVMEGMTSANKFVQKAEDALLNSSPTYSGIARNKLYGKSYTAVKNAVDSVSGEGSPYTKAELGNELKQQLSGGIKEENEPIVQIYQIIKGGHTNIPLESGALEGLQHDMSSIDSIQLSPSSPQAKLANRVIQEIPGLKTVDDVKRYKTLLNNSINYQSASPGEREVVSQLSDKLSQFEHDQVLNFAEKADLPPDTRKAVNDLIPMRKVADIQYKTFINKIQKLAKQLGKKSISGPGHAINFITNELTPEQITQRLFSKNNTEFLKFFSKEFPEQMNLMRQYQKDILRETAMGKDHMFSPAKYFTAVNKLEPEVQKALFSPDELQKLKDAQTISESWPKAFNPSGTDHTSAFREFFHSPSGAALGNLRDLAIDQFIKKAKTPKKYADGGVVDDSMAPPMPPSPGGIPPIGNMEKFVKAVGHTPQIHNAIKMAQAAVKGEKLVSNSVAHVFNPQSKHEIPRASEKDVHKLKVQVDRASQDPTRLFNIGSTHHESVPEYSSAFGMTASRAVEYLNSIKPKEFQAGPLDPKIPPAKYQQDNYNRALQIAEQPLSILHHIKHGTIVPQDIMTLKSIYPDLYSHLSNKFTESVAHSISKKNPIPYNTRISMGLFMAQPMDSTMTPSAIMSAQPQATQNQMNPPPKSQGKSAAGNGLDKLAQSYQTPNQERQKELSTK